MIILFLPNPHMIMIVYHNYFVYKTNKYGLIFQKNKEIRPNGSNFQLGNAIQFQFLDNITLVSEIVLKNYKRKLLRDNDRITLTLMLTTKKNIL
eukprot:UN02062